MRLCQGFFIFYFCSLLNEYYAHLRVPMPNINTNEKRLGPCQTCKLFIESFKDGIENTARGKHEGGDAAWEEEKLRSYSKSELRLVEIQEGLCNVPNKEQCLQIGEQSEDIIEEWWFQEEPREDLYEWLCIEKLELCCPKNHFGKKCNPCIGTPNNVCHNNGKCKGDGTRKGNGQCLCDTGYAGTDCSLCDETFYESYRDNNKMLCSPCHKSCKDSCSQGGSKGCTICKEGWTMNSEFGCLEVNECLNSLACEGNQFCVNTEGSYTCLQCDKSCNGCSGDGPDMCDKCNSGYNLRDGICIDAEIENMEFRLRWTRYLTYLGLFVATCITFQKSIYLAAIVGILVAVYISISEYILQSLSDPEKSPKSVRFGEI